jgi:hypothetical protein
VAAIADNYFKILCTQLEHAYVPHLPTLIHVGNKSAEDIAKKNLSRSFGAFALASRFDLAPDAAARHVLDDYDDNGIDAFYYDEASATLLLLQSKFKKDSAFRQEDAQALCDGVRRLVQHEFQNVNAHVLSHQADIEQALDACASIKLVVVHIGAEITEHAKQSLLNFLSDFGDVDDRIAAIYDEFDGAAATQALLRSKEPLRVHDKLCLSHSKTVGGPIPTYIGVGTLVDFMDLHDRYDSALYNRNIRLFLGLDASGVNQDIQATLRSSPDSFFHRNNGITVLGSTIQPGAVRGGTKAYRIRDFSVINGAQTIGAAARLRREEPGIDLSSVRVFVTLIASGDNDDLAKELTKARNHQNPISVASFASLEIEQETLRREISYLGLTYHYRPEETVARSESDVLIQDAAVALSWLKNDPRYAIQAKRSPAELRDVRLPAYSELFRGQLTGAQLVNAVRFHLVIQDLVHQYESGARGAERLFYRHAVHALGWIFFKRSRNRINPTSLVDGNSIAGLISAEFDRLRHESWNYFSVLAPDAGPLAFFQSQTHTIPFIAQLMENHFSLSGDPALGHVKASSAAESFPKEYVVRYLCAKAPGL